MKVEKENRLGARIVASAVKLLIGATLEHLKREFDRVERELEQPSRTIRRYGADCRLLAPSSVPDAADAGHAGIIRVRKRKSLRLNPTPRRRRMPSASRR